MSSRRVLFVSSNRDAAGDLERRLGAEYEVHAAATDESAFTLLDQHPYACVVVDLCSRPSSSIRLNALTTSVIAIVAGGEETVLPGNTIACINDGETADRLAAMVRRHCSR